MHGQLKHIKSTWTGARTTTIQPNDSIMQLTYGQLFQFMGTFSNEELDDAQVIATYHSKGHDYDQVLIRVLVEMRESQLAS
jgi:hypothetical protein